ncbi:MAG: outer membrane beta-barrel protein, partial [Mesorhizobium sp.]|nr:outer membrane beta-barrel protein [Mesorhizobium sp.]
HDRYRGQDIAVGGAGFGGTIGEVTTNSFASPGNKLNYSSQTVRISAIYQFGGDDQPPPAYLTASDWTGFYIGGGLTMQNHALEFLNSTMRLSMTNNQTGVTEVYEPSQAYNGDSIGGHLLAGYSHQFGRFVLGAEADVELNSRFSRDASVPDSAFGGAAGPECLNPPSGVPSIPPGHFGCVGLRQNFGEVKTYGHVRAKLGVEVTPALMTFVTGGLAVGRAPDYFSVTASGIIVNNPSSPLAGQATVIRTGVDKVILGYSIGGGVEVKVSQNLRLRTEYMYDDYGTVEQLPLGGAGFGGTLGDLTTNSFVGIGNGGVTQSHISSQTVRVSAIYQF